MHGSLIAPATPLDRGGNVRRNPKQTFRMAIALMLALFMVACGAGDDGTDEVRPVATEPVVGACIEDASVLKTGDFTPADLVFVDCAGVHDAEIAGVIEIDGEEYPGQDVIGPQYVGGECPDTVSSYLDDPDMLYSEVAWAPDEPEWEDGYRTVLCFVVAPGPEIPFEGPVGG